MVTIAFPETSPGPRPAPGGQRLRSRGSQWCRLSGRTSRSFRVLCSELLSGERVVRVRWRVLQVVPGFLLPLVALAEGQRHPSFPCGFEFFRLKEGIVDPKPMKMFTQ